MSESAESAPDPAAAALGRVTRSQRRRLLAGVLVRAALVASALLALYYVLPFDRSLTAGVVLLLIGGLLLVAIILAWEVRAIVRSDHPVVRAVEALALAIPLFLVIFATVYFLLAHDNSAAFTQTLTRTDSLYFTITVFSTVGFGDIAPKTELARGIVSVQMLTDLVLIGLVLHAIVGAARMSVERRYGSNRPLEPLEGSGPST